MHGRLRVGVPTGDQFQVVNIKLVGSVIPNRPCRWLIIRWFNMDGEDQFCAVNFTLVGSVIPNRPCRWLIVGWFNMDGEDQFCAVNFTLVGSVIPNRPCGTPIVESSTWTARGRRPYRVKFNDKNTIYCIKININNYMATIYKYFEKSNFFILKQNSLLLYSKSGV